MILRAMLTMQNLLKPHFSFPARGVLACALALLASASAAGSPTAIRQTPSEAPPTPAESAQTSEIEFAELSFDDAISRAERTQKILVILWTGDNEAKNAAMKDRVFGDAGVRRWIQENAEAVTINALERKRDAKKNGLAAENVPSVDILDVARGGRVERLRANGTAVQFLAAVFGIGDAERPTGEDVNEPFRWLAWANRRNREDDDQAAMDAVTGYEWCLTRADQYRPGFRAKYLEFLLQRVAYCKQRTPRATEVLFGDRIRILEKLGAGIAEESDIYELTRVDFWLRKELLTRDVYVDLGKGAKRGAEYRLWLLPTVLPVLGRFQQYDEILDVVGDRHLALFKERIEGLKSKGGDANDPEGAGAGADAEGTDAQGPSEEGRIPTSLDFAPGDSRADIIEDASWVYEALLSVGRGKDAKDLMELITTAFPVNKAFGLFMERAMRLKVWAAATEIGDLGMAMLDERGQKRMQRLLQKIPKDDDAGK
ncbi:MAG: hypothetical protein AAGG01_15405 [Planctomycetota bacterium]